MYSQPQNNGSFKLLLRAALLNLAVEGIAAWVELDMVTSVEDEMIMFCKGSVSALSLFIPDAQHCVGTRTGTEATTVQREAMRAGFSRYAC